MVGVITMMVVWAEKELVVSDVGNDGQTDGQMDRKTYGHTPY